MSSRFESKTVEVSFDTKYNSNISFQPLGQVIRGRFVLHRVPEPLAASHFDRLGNEIPGQRIQLDLENKKGRIYEPLWEEEFREAKQRIETVLKNAIPSQGPWVPAHMPTWVFWLKRLIDGGIGIISPGAEKLPTDIVGTPRISQFARKDQEELSKELRAELRKSREENEALIDLIQQYGKRLDAIEGKKKVS